METGLIWEIGKKYKIKDKDKFLIVLEVIGVEDNLIVFIDKYGKKRGYSNIEILQFREVDSFGGEKE